MANYPETYPLTAFTTSGGVVALDKLADEIHADPNILIDLGTDRISVDSINCYINFKDQLPAGQKTPYLDNIVTAHDGIPPDDPGLPVAISGESRSSDGTLQIADRPLTLGQESFKRTDIGTEALNVDGTASGSVTNIWDGDSGSGDWTPSGEGSATSGSAHTGSYGWDTGVVGKDETTLFTNTVDIDVSGYAQLSFWIQPKAFPSGSRLDIRWQTMGGSDRGQQLDVADYVTDYDLDVWHKVTIPMVDFSIGLDVVGRLRLTYAKEAGQQFWFDEFEFTASGGGDGPFIFSVEAPDTSECYHVSMIVLMLSGLSTGWDSDAFANIDALINGLVLRHRRVSDGEVLWSFNSKDNMDLFGRYHPQEDVEFADGVLLMGFMVKPGSASVVITDDEVLELVVRDDLSGLAGARAYVHYGIEVLA